jgi:hypothetical protein
VVSKAPIFFWTYNQEQLKGMVAPIFQGRSGNRLEATALLRELSPITTGFLDQELPLSQGSPPWSYQWESHPFALVKRT